jgi:hypothetical protein
MKKKHDKNNLTVTIYREIVFMTTIKEIVKHYFDLVSL